MSLQPGSLHYRATDVGSRQLNKLGVYNLERLILELWTHSHGSLQSESLQNRNLKSGSLLCRGTDLGSRQPLTWERESTGWEWAIDLGSGNPLTGVYSLGV